MSEIDTALENPSLAEPQAPVEPDAAEGGALPTDVLGDSKTWVEYIALQYARTLMTGLADNPARKANYASHAMALLEQLAPRDAVEQMLAGQLIVLQARIQFLNRVSLNQQDSVWSHLYSSQLDRAIAGYHKALASLKEHHRPRPRRRQRQRTSVTTIRTAHITAQQVIGPPLQLQATHAIPSQSQIQEAQPERTQSASPAQHRQT